MSGIDVDLGVLGSIASGLDSGADGLEGLSGSVPGGIDAGPMTAVIAGMLSQVVDSAGNVSTSMSAAADAVRMSRRYYERADADAQAGMDQIREAMAR
jgi:hypothetical protein